MLTPKRPREQTDYRVQRFLGITLKSSQIICLVDPCLYRWVCVRMYMFVLFFRHRLLRRSQYFLENKNQYALKLKHVHSNDKSSAFLLKLDVHKNQGQTFEVTIHMRSIPNTILNNHLLCYRINQIMLFVPLTLIQDKKLKAVVCR